MSEDCLLQFADYNQEVFICHEKHNNSESTLISRSFQVCSGLHAPQLRKTIVRPNVVVLYLPFMTEYKNINKVVSK